MKITIANIARCGKTARNCAKSDKLIERGVLYNLKYTVARIEKCVYLHPVSALSRSVQSWKRRGNQVKILNRPAAVSSVKGFCAMSLVHCSEKGREGSVKTEQVRRPAGIVVFKAFEE